MPFGSKLFVLQIESNGNVVKHLHSSINNQKQNYMLWMQWHYQTRKVHSDKMCNVMSQFNFLIQKAQGNALEIDIWPSYWYQLLHYYFWKTDMSQLHFIVEFENRQLCIDFEIKLVFQTITILRQTCSIINSIYLR